VAISIECEGEYDNGIGIRCAKYLEELSKLRKFIGSDENGYKKL